MSTATKKRILYPLLVALTLWPLVHIGLVLAYDTSSWKLAGWGMYATPQRVPGLEVRGFRGNRMEAVFIPPYPDWVQAEVLRFSKWRRALGALYPPDRLAKAVQENRPELDRIEIDVVELHLDPGTAMLEKRHSRYAYEGRAGDAGAGQ